jgi:FkbM family methyltransferase
MMKNSSRSPGILQRYIVKMTRILHNLKHPLQAVDSMLWMHKARWRRTYLDSTVYDVGMHEGQDTAFYLKKGFRVIAIEANRVLTDAAQRRFAPFVASGQLSILNVGIAASETAGDIEFFINDRISEWSSFDRKIAGRKGSTVHSVFVPTSTLASVIARFGPAYFVKIDIEGYDAIALQSLLSTEPKPRYVSVENGNQGMLGMLVAAGYDRFKYIQQRDLYKFRVTRPAREGRYAGHLFPRGASGPFGEETPGRWSSAEQIREEIAKIWDVDGTAKQQGHDDKTHGWFDLHARHSGAPISDTGIS